MKKHDMKKHGMKKHGIKDCEHCKAGVEFMRLLSTRGPLMRCLETGETVRIHANNRSCTT